MNSLTASHNLCLIRTETRLIRDGSKFIPHMFTKWLLYGIGKYDSENAHCMKNYGKAMDSNLF